jgi:hypothetical protein
MSKAIRITLVLILTAIGSVRPQELIGVSKNIAVANPRFWVNVPDVGHVETNSFVWKAHALYGWSLEAIIPPGSTGKWYAAYKYPAPSEFLMNPANTHGKVSDNFTQVTEEPKPFAANDNKLQDLCLVMPGEPAGKYKITVYVSIASDGKQRRGEGHRAFRHRRHTDCRNLCRE